MKRALTTRSEEHEASKVFMKKETKIDSRWKELTGKQI
jgi:hypothetical protein